MVQIPHITMFVIIIASQLNKTVIILSYLMLKSAQNLAGRVMRNIDNTWNGLTLSDSVILVTPVYSNMCFGFWGRGFFLHSKVNTRWVKFYFDDTVDPCLKKPKHMIEWPGVTGITQSVMRLQDCPQIIFKRSSSYSVEPIERGKALVFRFLSPSLSPPVHIARWAHICRFLSVCLSVTWPNSLDNNSYLRKYYR